MWRYHANRMDARRSQFEVGRVDASRAFRLRGQQCSCFRTRNTFCRTRSLFNGTFSFFDHVMKFEWFFTEIWRYIDFQNGGHPSSWNCFTTIWDHPRSPCQILCQSDIQIWRYSCLNFSHIWLEVPIQVRQIGVLGDFGLLTVIIHHPEPQKAHPCVNSRLLSYQL